MKQVLISNNFIVCSSFRYFYRAYNYMGKEDLCDGYWNPQRKLRVAMHFSEITKFQFRKMPYLVMYFQVF